MMKTQIPRIEAQEVRMWAVYLVTNDSFGGEEFTKLWEFDSEEEADEAALGIATELGTHLETWEGD